VAAYNAVEAAADLVDLRHALGAPRWNVTSYGVGSRLALELLRQEATGFRTLVLDSPDVPHPTPAPDRLLDRAMASLERRPLHLRVDHHGQPMSVVLDPGLLARSLRQLAVRRREQRPLLPT
jgi:pimeloyl-ACP methyl ester carboxylesterase